eukprot:5870364-Prymnesium_polylepis.1
MANVPGVAVPLPTHPLRLPHPTRGWGASPPPIVPGTQPPKERAFFQHAGGVSAVTSHGLPEERYRSRTRCVCSGGDVPQPAFCMIPFGSELSVNS